MWNRLVWRRAQNPEVERTIRAVREDMLSHFLGITAAGYALWQFGSTLLAPTEDAPRTWVVFPIVVPCLAITYILWQRRFPIVAEYFLVSSVLAVTAAMWLLSASAAAFLYPLVAFAAVFLLHPFAGVLFGLGSLGFLTVLRESGPLAFLSTDRLIETAVLSLVVVSAAWAVNRNMITALDWWHHSYEQASRNARIAQDHRAQLVRTLKQLDSAYYRLQQANAALELAWKSAEAAERSKSEFVTNMSHELRTPLNLITGFSELILTSPETYGADLPAAFRGDLNAIYRSAQHLLTLTNDVIDLARIGVERLALVREQVNLATTIDEACAIMREYVTAKGLWLRIEVQPDLPALTVDRVRVRQVLLNLLTNAIRFTQQGGVTISASVERDWVRVSVADTGCGIVPENLPMVFVEYFHESQDARSPSSLGGIGLGLPISKRLIELHGGQMGVESTLGVGTTFWFTLPTHTVDGAVQSDTWRPLRPVGLSKPSSRVLVVAGSERQFSEFLHQHIHGHHVLTAPDLQTAARLAMEFHAVAIVTDLGEAEQDGGSPLAVPIIRIPTPRGAHIASNLGVAAYIVKPVTRSELLSTIAQLKRPIHRILVADDDSRFLRLLTRMLCSDPQRHDYAVLTAHNGQEALAMMRSTRPDLLLLDLAMPEQGGHEVLTSMRADTDLVDIPVIIISAHDQIADRFPLQGQLSIERPEGFHPDELLRAIEALLGALDPCRPS